ncbi:Fibronectin type III [Trinorchestia longiramus]|nr:Fibronectin type III [Trinorchestia longiramus]
MLINKERLHCAVTVKESPLSEHTEITGLRPSSSMIFSLSVVSVVGTSRNSLPVGLQLPEDVPGGPPLSLSVESASNVSLSLSWKPPLAAVTNGELTHYIVSTQPPSKQVTVPAPLTQVTVSHLSPFTWYRVMVYACTRPGCATDHPAIKSAHTLPGLPSAVDLFSLNSIDGEISWAFPDENCHSSACSFDVRIASNSSSISITGLQENSLSLEEHNITCEDKTSLNVSVRAVGTDANNSLLHGPWNSREGPCTVAAVTFVPWWIWLLVVAGVLVPFVCFVCAKCGFSVFLEMTGPVKVPDLKSGELKNSSQNKLKPDTMNTGPTSGQVLFNPPYASLPNMAPTRSAHPFDIGKRMPLLSQSSVNSEMDNTEDSGDRNLSGNSPRSSSGGLSDVDSALASIADGQDSASASSQDSANICLRQNSEVWPPVSVRQRSPGPYVLHGQRPTKVNVCEGYVAVRSDPSLHSPDHRNCDATALAHFLPIKPFPISTRCPSSAESDQLRVHPSYSRRSSSSLLLNNKNNNFTSPPHSNASSPLPAYSRHSFTPPGQLKTSSSPADIPVETDLNELQYACAAFNSDYSRLSTPESVTHQMVAKQRPSTIASNLSFEKSVVKNDMPDVTCNAPGAYSVVGKRKNVVQPVSSSQGYVTLSNQIPRAKFPSFLDHASTTTKNEQENSCSDDNTPYLLNSSQALPSSSEISANYCTLEDLESLPGIYQKYHSNGRASNADNATISSNSCTMLDSEQSSVASDGQKQNIIVVNDRWAFSNPRPRQLDFADEVRFVASAPIENHRGRKCSQKDSDELHLPSGRPNTSDGVGGRPQHLSHSPPSMWLTGAPSLSKQSSGYVSQEALSTDPLVISPKRLFAHSQEGKSSKSIPQEVSFV